MWAAARRGARAAPLAAAVAVPLNGAVDSRRGADERHPARCWRHGASSDEHVGRRRLWSTLRCEEPQGTRGGRNGGRSSSVLIPCGQQTRKGTGLLGRRDFIYRLLCKGRLEDEFVLERELGKGAFGTVFLARHKAMGFTRAIKKIPKDGDNHEELMNEIYSLMDLDHPHIIKMSRFFEDGSNIYIVAELCHGPDLFDRMVEGPMTEREATIALRHILKALHCIHSKYLGHYDIKPENFMYGDTDRKKLKMIDLGLSSAFKRGAQEVKGTVVYTAPEMWKGTYGPEADMWSCGTILFLMATGRSLCPMDASDSEVEALLQDRLWVKERLQWAAERGVSRPLLDMLQAMLAHDRHMRITAREALASPLIVSTYERPNESPEDTSAAIAVIDSVVENFAKYSREPALKRACLLMMAHIGGYISHHAKPNRSAFAMLDRIGIGELSVVMLEASLLRCGSHTGNLDEAFRGVDLNQDGYITYLDFLAATLPYSLCCQEDFCRMVFDLLDRNGDGVIDPNDLASAFFNHEEREEVENLSACIEAMVEVSGSVEKETLTFEEFFTLMRGSHPSEDSKGLDDDET